MFSIVQRSQLSEHGSHCIYITATYFEQLSIFEGEWVCVVTGDRDTNHIVSCHVASAQLFLPEVTPEKTAQYSSGEDACSASECCYVSSQYRFLLSNGSCIDNSRPIFVEIIALPLYSGPNTENDVPIQTHLLPNAPAFTSAHMQHHLCILHQILLVMRALRIADAHLR